MGIEQAPPHRVLSAVNPDYSDEADIGFLVSPREFAPVSVRFS
jgi:hypothetical protein